MNKLSVTIVEARNLHTTASLMRATTPKAYVNARLLVETDEGTTEKLTKYETKTVANTAPRFDESFAWYSPSTLAGATLRVRVFSKRSALVGESVAKRIGLGSFNLDTLVADEFLGEALLSLRDVIAASAEAAERRADAALWLPLRASKRYSDESVCKDGQVRVIVHFGDAQRRRRAATGAAATTPTTPTAARSFLTRVPLLGALLVDDEARREEQRRLKELRQLDRPRRRGLLHKMTGGLLGGAAATRLSASLTRDVPFTEDNDADASAVAPREDTRARSLNDYVGEVVHCASSAAAIDDEARALLGRRRLLPPAATTAARPPHVAHVLTDLVFRHYRCAAHAADAFDDAQQAAAVAATQRAAYVKEAAALVARESTATARLELELVAARALPAKDITGASDPFFVVQLGGDARKTRVHKRTLAPQLNESFRFTLPLRDADARVLELTCFDWNFASAEQFMGACALNIFDALATVDALDAWLPLHATAAAARALGDADDDVVVSGASSPRDRRPRVHVRARLSFDYDTHFRALFDPQRHLPTLKLGALLDGGAVSRCVVDTRVDHAPLLRRLLRRLFFVAADNDAGDAAAAAAVQWPRTDDAAAALRVVAAYGERFGLPYERLQLEIFVMATETALAAKAARGVGALVTRGGLGTLQLAHEALANLTRALAIDASNDAFFLSRVEQAELGAARQRLLHDVVTPLLAQFKLALSSLPPDTRTDIVFALCDLFREISPTLSRAACAEALGDFVQIATRTHLDRLIPLDGANNDAATNDDEEFDVVTDDAAPLNGDMVVGFCDIIQDAVDHDMSYASAFPRGAKYVARACSLYGARLRRIIARYTATGGGGGDDDDDDAYDGAWLGALQRLRETTSLLRSLDAAAAAAAGLPADDAALRAKFIGFVFGYVKRCATLLSAKIDAIIEADDHRGESENVFFSTGCVDVCAAINDAYQALVAARLSSQRLVTVQFAELSASLLSAYAAKEQAWLDDALARAVAAAHGDARRFRTTLEMGCALANLSQTRSFLDAQLSLYAATNARYSSSSAVARDDEQLVLAASMDSLRAAAAATLDDARRYAVTRVVARSHTHVDAVFDALGGDSGGAQCRRALDTALAHADEQLATLRAATDDELFARLLRASLRVVADAARRALRRVASGGDDAPTSAFAERLTAFYVADGAGLDAAEVREAAADVRRLLDYAQSTSASLITAYWSHRQTVELLSAASADAADAEATASLVAQIDAIGDVLRARARSATLHDAAARAFLHETESTGSSSSSSSLAALKSSASSFVRRLSRAGSLSSSAERASGDEQAATTTTTTTTTIPAAELSDEARLRLLFGIGGSASDDNVLLDSFYARCDALVSASGSSMGRLYVFSRHICYRDLHLLLPSADDDAPPPLAPAERIVLDMSAVESLSTKSAFLTSSLVVGCSHGRAFRFDKMMHAARAMRLIVAQVKECTGRVVRWQQS